MTKDELRKKMSTREFYEWVAFYNYEAKMQKELERKAGKNPKK